MVLECTAVEHEDSHFTPKKLYPVQQISDILWMVTCDKGCQKYLNREGNRFISGQFPHSACSCSLKEV